MFEELKRLLRYLQGTMELGIRFTSDKNDIVPIVHADADYNNDVDTRRSHTGYVALFQGGPVSWTSNLQQSVTLQSLPVISHTAAGTARQLMPVNRLRDPGLCQAAQAY